MSSNSVHTSLQAYYDSRHPLYNREPKYVAGRRTFADENGIWQIDLETESWDTDVDFRS